MALDSGLRLLGTWLEELHGRYFGPSEPAETRSFYRSYHIPRPHLQNFVQ